MSRNYTENNNLWTNGYNIQLYQYARLYKYNRAGFELAFEKQDEIHGQEYIVFGEFDMMEIRPIEDFHGFMNASDVSKHWIGKRQSLLLYHLDQQPVLYFGAYKNKNDHVQCDHNIQDDIANLSLEWQYQNGERCCMDGRFLCITQLTMTNDVVLNKNNYLELMRDIRQKLTLRIRKKCKTLGINRDALAFEIMGSFNASELVIVWIARDYTNVMSLLDVIKYIKITPDSVDGTSMDSIDLFFSTNTTITVKKNFRASLFDGLKDGFAQMTVTIQDSLIEYDSVKAIANRIKGEEGEIESIVGEFDFSIRIPAKRALILLQKKSGDVNADPDEGYLCHLPGETNIYDRILRVSTNLGYLARRGNDRDNKNILLRSKELLPIQVKSLEGTSSYDYRIDVNEILNEKTAVFISDEREESIDTIYHRIRENIKDHIHSSAGAIDTLDLLYTDFLSVVSTSYDSLWVSDVHRQFKAVLTILDSYFPAADHIKSDKRDADWRSWKWENYQNLINAFKQQIFHMEQANGNAVKAPISHLRETGQFDFLIHAYYGIVKDILSVIYHLKGVGQQSEIVPLITVNAVPMIRSQLYFPKEPLHNGHKIRLVNLDIPLSLIYDPFRGIRYMVHELFHYCAPFNRTERNQYMSIILDSLFLMMQIMRMLKVIMTSPVDMEKRSKYSSSKTKDIDQSTVDDLIYKYYNCNAKNEQHELFFAEDNLQVVLKYMEKHVAEKKKKGKQFRDQLWMNHRSEQEKRFAGNDIWNEYLNDPTFKTMVDIIVDNYLTKLEEKLESDGTELLEKIGSNLSLDKRNSKNTENYRREVCNQKIRETLISRCEYYLNNKKIISQMIHGYILNTEGNLYLFQTIDENWLQSIREACSDIGMITLTQMQFEDYLLLCIQSWKNEGHQRYLEAMNLEQKERNRFAMVMHYCTRKRIIPTKKNYHFWYEPSESLQNLADQWNPGEFQDINQDDSWKEDDRKYLRDPFVVKYIRKYHNKNNTEEGCRKEALNWLAGAIQWYNDMTVGLLLPYTNSILEQYDVDIRMAALNKAPDFNMDHNIDEVKRIQAEFSYWTNRIYNPLLYPDLHNYYMDQEKSAGMDNEGIYPGFPVLEQIRDGGIITPHNNMDTVNEENYNRHIDNTKRFLYELYLAMNYHKPSTFRNLAEILYRKEKLSITNEIREKNTFKLLFECKKADRTAKESVDITDICPKSEIHIKSMKELLFYLERCETYLKETAESLIGSREDIVMENPREIWYRGETASRRTLFPLLLRNFNEKRYNQFQKSLRKYQQFLYETEKYKADGRLELDSNSIYTVSDYLALFQHYGGYTNMLDWSEDALVSLGFALMKYMDGVPGVKYGEDDTRSNAELDIEKKFYRNTELILFHPGIYNYYRQQRIHKVVDDHGDELEKSDYSYLEKIVDFSQNSNLIPNLSLADNAEQYDMFLLGDKRFDRIIQKHPINKEMFPALEPLFWPVACYPSRLNRRIKAQSGSFLAYNLYAPSKDNGCKKPDYNYLEISHIQEQEEKTPFDQKKGPCRFMFRIEIDRECCQEIVSFVKSMGMDESRLYVELEKSMTKLMKEIN